MVSLGFDFVSLGGVMGRFGKCDQCDGPLMMVIGGVECYNCGYVFLSEEVEVVKPLFLDNGSDDNNLVDPKRSEGGNDGYLSGE